MSTFQMLITNVIKIISIINVVAFITISIVLLLKEKKDDMYSSF